MRPVPVVIAFCVIVSSATGWAHPPSGITVSNEGTTVTVTVNHTVSDPATHYIDEIDLTVNGGQAAAQKFTTQTGMAGQTAVYRVPSLRPGDTIEVRAACSRSGKLTKTVTAR